MALASNDVLDALKPVFADDAILKIGQNMKYDAKVLARYGVEIAPIDDVRGSAAYKRLLARRLLLAHVLRLAPDAVRFEELV